MHPRAIGGGGGAHRRQTASTYDFTPALSRCEGARRDSVGCFRKATLTRCSSRRGSVPMSDMRGRGTTAAPTATLSVRSAGADCRCTTAASSTSGRSASRYTCVTHGMHELVAR